MTQPLTHITGADSIWAILPAALPGFRARLELPQDGTTIEAARTSPRAAVTSGSAGGTVAVLPLMGEVVPRDPTGVISMLTGATPIDQFAAAFHQAMQDPSIGGIVINVDSPGGSVVGVDELASAIYAARGTKPIVAVATGMAASAAYWIATAADQLVVTPSGEVGSIGVFVEHWDMSGALDQAGIKSTIISAGPYKAETASSRPLTPDAQNYLQSRVNDYYAMFTSRVAKNRGVSVQTVKSGFGQGRMVGARAAVEQGMADAIGTLDQVVGKMLRQLPSSGPRLTRADLDELPFAAVDALEVATDVMETIAEQEPQPPTKTGLSVGLAERRLRLSRN